MTTCFRLLLLTSLAFSVCLPAVETVIINPKNVTPALSDNDMRELFLGMKSSWSDGTKVVVVMLRDGPAHEALLKLLGRNQSQFNTSWKKVVFTGRGTLPHQANSEADLVEFVAKNPGAIGFVDVGNVKEVVKAVSVK